MNWKQAFAVGVIPPGMWDGKGEATMYLYGGVVLPDIYSVYTPEIQKTHPFVFIQRNVLGIPLILVATEIKYGVTSSGKRALYATAIAIYKKAEGWVDYNEDGSEGLYGFSRILWSNFDILNEDGTVYLAATDPIPVYE